MPRRRHAAAAVLATAVLAVLVPGAGTPAAPPVSIAELRNELLAAIADEKRALELLAKEPPRDRAAELMLDRSIERLRRIDAGLQRLSLPPWVRGSARAASGYDDVATGRLPPFNQAIRELAIDEIERALREKNQLRGWLIPPRPAGGSQCADGRDNDGDRLVDARFESGCTSTKDSSESSPLTCTLGTGIARDLSELKGSCSGAFAKVELIAPQGAMFDTTRMPVAPLAELCRYSSPRRLECLMSDGATNPRHVVNIRFKLRSGQASRLRALIRDFAGRGRTWTPAPTDPGRPRADLRVTAEVTTAFLDRNGQGQVTGTVAITNLGPNEASGVRLRISANRVDSARAATVTFLPCAKTESGVACTVSGLSTGNELGFSFSLPVNGAGQLTVAFELVGDTPDPQPANNKATVSAELRPSP